MLILDEIKELKTGPRELRKFGLLVGGVCAALGLLYVLRGKHIYPWFLYPGLVLLVFGATLPQALRHVYIVWMSLAVVLGFIVSNVLLTVFFFIVITPIGLVARLSGKDFLRLKLDRNAPTYWMPRASQRDRARSDYEKQF